MFKNRVFGLSESPPPNDKQQIIKDFHMIDNPTWRDLLDAIQKANFNYGLGYLSFETYPKDYSNVSIESHVVSYWVVGGSEGYWVHVQQMYINENIYEHTHEFITETTYTLSPLIIILKFLGLIDDKKSAIEANEFILEILEDNNIW